jgi:hypothetical protein
MSGWYPRLSPDGRHVASGHTTITVDGVEISPDGTGPIWANDAVLLYGRHSDGALMGWGLGAIMPSLVTLQGGNGIAAAGERWVIYRTDPVRLLLSNGTTQLGLRDPALSDSGEHLAALDQDTSALVLNGQVIDTRPCLNPRFGSETLCWESDRRIYGVTTPGQPVADLTIPGLHQYKPVPIWANTAGLWVLSHTDDAVILQAWGTTRGYVIYRGETDGPHDARLVGPDRIRVVWSVRGILQDAVMNVTTTAMEDLSPHDDEWTDTAPIDLLPFIVGDPERWPRHGSHDLRQTWNGRDLHLIKFANSETWERWVLDGDQFYLREDRSQSGAGDYSFHPGRWFARRMALGQWIDCPDNILQRYDPGTCHVIDQHALPYRVGLVRAWRRLDLGGEIGIVERVDGPAAVLLVYDPGGAHDTIESYLCVLGWGLVRWRVQDQDDPEIFNETTFNLLGGSYVTPNAGCYRALQAPPSDPEIPMSVTPQQILDSMQRWPWDLDVEHLETFRQAVWVRDQGSDVPSRGALAYYHRAMGAAVTARCIELGRALHEPNEWGPAFDRGVTDAIAAYRREQAPDPEDHQDPQ